MSDCVFCNIPTSERVEQWERIPGVHHNGWPFYAVKPINPVTEGHTLIVPHAHRSAADMDPALYGKLMEAAAGWAHHMKIAQLMRDFNIIQSNGHFATQTVPHLHVHIVPRNDGDGLLLPWSGQQADQAIASATEKLQDRRPHSRACGPFCRGHGTACNPNCPTCGGRKDEATWAH